MQAHHLRAHPLLGAGGGYSGEEVEQALHDMYASVYALRTQLSRQEVGQAVNETIR